MNKTQQAFMSSFEERARKEGMTINTVNVHDMAIQSWREENEKLRNEVILLRDAVDSLVEAAQNMLENYRSEGCPDKDCRVCKRSKQATEQIRAAIKKAEAIRGNLL